MLQTIDMKILYINNYACEKQYISQVENYTFLSNHLWGVYELQAQGYQVDYINSNDLPVFEGSRNFITKLIYSYKRNKYLKNKLTKYENYDVIYSAITGSKQMDYFAKLKKKKAIKSKLIAVLHHPVNRVKYAEIYDKIFILSKEVMKNFNYSNQEFLFWGPELSFFDHWSTKVGKDEKKINYLKLLSNGKTHRNHNEFLHAAEHLDVAATIICDQASLPKQEFLTNEKFTIIYPDDKQKPLSAIENTKMVSETDVMIIPVDKNNYHLCGLTSFVDAIALGKPILCQAIHSSM